jgi:hypothetical protein
MEIDYLEINKINNYRSQNNQNNQTSNFSRGNTRNNYNNNQNRDKGKGPRGNCFECGQHGHFAKNCPKKKNQLRVLEEQPEYETHNQIELTHIPTNCKGLLRINEKVDGIAAQILIDSGATRNFVDRNFAETNNLQITSDKEITIELANGTKEKSHAVTVIRNLDLGPYHTSDVTAHLISLQRDDMILGQSWLVKANPQIDWRTKTLTFQYGHKTIRVKSICNETPNPPSINSLFISRKQFAGIAELNELFAVFLEPDVSTSSLSPPPQVKQLYKDFQDVFPESLPNHLPPKRKVDHAIELIPGSEPPFRSIYRMSYKELNELKRQLADLTVKGFI